jgi:hypothetical protein
MIPELGHFALALGCILAAAQGDADMGNAADAAQAWGRALVIRADAELETRRAAAAAIAKQSGQGS